MLTPLLYCQFFVAHRKVFSASKPLHENETRVIEAQCLRDILHHGHELSAGFGGVIDQGRVQGARGGNKEIEAVKVGSGSQLHRIRSPSKSRIRA